MATFMRRGDKWFVQVRRKGFPTACRSFRQRADADEWARFMEVRADRGELPTPVKVLDSYKVKDILLRYRDEISVKKRSHDNERHVLNALMRQPFASLSLAEITASHFCDHRDTRLKEVLPGTVRRELAIVSHAFDVAEREWTIPIRENPIKKLAKIKPQAGRTRRLLDGEFETIREAAELTRNPYVMPVIRFAIATGMRRGEILRIKWTDINFATKTLHIEETKNGHARTIPLSSAAIAVLDELREWADRREKRVFPLSVNAFKMAWRRLRDRTGIDDLHFHDMRHEAISSFVERGLSVPEVALISGHRDYRMLSRYTHLKPENLVPKLG